MKYRITGTALALLLLVGGAGVSAGSNSNNGLPEQLAELQTTISNLVNEVKDILPLKDDIKSVKDELNTANLTISELQTQLDSMKKEIVDLKSSSSGPEVTLTPEVKQSLLKEFEVHKPFLSYWDNTTNQMVLYNITKIDFVESNGKIHIQTFLEGNYDWGVKYSTWGTPYTENGRQLSDRIVGLFSPLAKLYGLEDLHFEFYQNGQKIIFSNYPPKLVN